MKRKFERKYFFIIFMIVSGFFIFIALGNGFWRESAPYKIDSVEINAKLDENKVIFMLKSFLFTYFPVIIARHPKNYTYLTLRF